MAERGWAPDDGANEGLADRKAETDRLNEKSNADQQAASRPGPDTSADDAPSEDTSPTR